MAYGLEYIIPAVVGAAVSAAGTGVAMYSQQQQAENAQAVADYNYKLQQRQNAMQQSILSQQAAWRQQALSNNQQTALNNAAALNNEARAAEARAREDARRTREANQQRLDAQRARYAKSNVTSEGSPLLIMAETAGLLELGVQDAAYKAEMESRALDRRADLFRSDADNIAFDAGVAEYEAAAQQAGLRIELNQAKVDRASGYATAAGLRLSSFGSLLSGAGDIIDIGTSTYDSYKSDQLYKPKVTKTKALP